MMKRNHPMSKQRKNNKNKIVRVYIASPYTKGDVAVNVKRQLDCFDELVTLGFAPFAPLWSHFQHIVHPRKYEDWVMLDMEWVPVCHCILRLPGESVGADNEVTYAMKNNMPIFYSIADLVNVYPNGKID
jgi:hypothetical protein